MRVLGLIPARGGSKGVPRKNLADVGGRPLIALSIETGLASKRIDRLVVSTDDDEIAEAARSSGGDVPFVRPSGLADDDAPMLGVAQHALLTLASNGDNFDAVCILQPTSPLRSPELIDDCISLLESKEATSVVTVRSIPPEFNPAWAISIDGDGFASWAGGGRDPIGRRQDLPPAFHRDGLVYVARALTVLEGSLYGGSVVPALTDSIPLCNVDTMEDLEKLRAYVGKSG